MLSTNFRIVGFFSGISFAIVVLAASVTVSGAELSSSIFGTVFDDQRNPVIDVDVELLNENYALRGRTKTNGVGKYQFDGLSDGRWYVRVLPFRYNLNDQTIEVEINTFSILGTNASIVMQDFFLTRRNGTDPRLTTAVVFAQEIPREAELLYDEGVKAFDQKEAEKGTRRLLQAIEEFPEYFAAHQRLGIELLRMNEIKASVYYFNKAAEINPKSVGSFYNLGLALHTLGQEYNPAALVALKKARELSPSSHKIALQIGKLERAEGNLEEAEKYLIMAKELATQGDPEVHIELAQLYGNDLKEYGKAADELELYLKASNKKDKKTEAQIENLRKKAKQDS